MVYAGGVNALLLELRVGIIVIAYRAVGIGASLAFISLKRRS